MLTILLFTAATTAMSDYTCDKDASLPTFDRNTLENIMMCKASDKDDMRKLNTLFKKLTSEVRYRAQACMTYLMTEQKLLDDEHHMYPEHFSLLPWLH